MWSVVHLPKALINNFAFKIFSPSHGLKGSKSCNLSDVLLTETWIFDPSLEGARYPASSTSKPLGGSSHPVGSSSVTFSPLEFINESVRGLKSNLPEIAMAATISGEATKAWVFGFPSAH